MKKFAQFDLCDAKQALPVRSPTIVQLVNKSPCTIASHACVDLPAGRFADRLIIGEAAFYSGFSDAFSFP